MAADLKKTNPELFVESRLSAVQRQADAYRKAADRIEQEEAYRSMDATAFATYSEIHEQAQRCPQHSSAALKLARN